MIHGALSFEKVIKIAATHTQKQATICSSPLLVTVYVQLTHTLHGCVIVHQSYLQQISTAYGRGGYKNIDLNLALIAWKDS